MRPISWLGYGLFLAGWLAAGAARSQDVVTTRTQTFRGQVLSVSEAGIRIKLDQGGEITLPRASVTQVTVTPPPSVLRGLDAYDKGLWREAARDLSKVMEQYLGLDTEWAAKGLLGYGRASLMNRDYDNAAKALEAFLNTYPDHPLILAAQIGQASIELHRKQYEPALAHFRELAATFDTQIKPARDQVPMAAELHLGMGECLEGLDRKPEALEHYARVIGLYAAEPFYGEALYRAAALLAESGRGEQAAAMLKELTDKNPGSPFAEPALKLLRDLPAPASGAGG